MFSFNLYDSGKPYLQLAILSSYKNIVMDVVYYNFLGVGNVESSTAAKNNLLHYLQHQLRNDEQEAQHKSYLHFISEFLNIDDINIISVLSLEKEWMYDTSNYTNKQTLCLIILLHDLDNQFVVTSNTAFKQTIRNTQVLILNLIFTISNTCMDMTFQELENIDSEFSEFDSDGIMELIRASSLVLMYLSSHFSHLVNFTSYGKLLDHKLFNSVYLSIITKLMGFREYLSGLIRQSG